MAHAESLSGTGRYQDRGTWLTETANWLSRQSGRKGGILNHDGAFRMRIHWLWTSLPVSLSAACSPAPAPHPTPRSDQPRHRDRRCHALGWNRPSARVQRGHARAG